MWDLFGGMGNSLRNLRVDGLGTNLNDVLGSTAQATKQATEQATKGGFFSNLYDGIKGFLGGGANEATGRNNFDRLLDAGGLAGNLWGAYEKQKMAKKNFDLQKEAFNLNKDEHLRQVASRDKHNKQLEQIWGG